MCPSFEMSQETAVVQVFKKLANTRLKSKHLCCCLYCLCVVCCSLTPCKTKVTRTLLCPMTLTTLRKGVAQFGEEPGLHLTFATTLTLHRIF